MEVHLAKYKSCFLNVKTLQGLGMLSMSMVLWMQGFSGSMVLWFRGGRSSPKETEVERSSLGLQEVDEDKTKV